MSKASIAATLRKKRKEAGLPVKEVRRLMLEAGTFVSEKTIYGWENAYSQPDADTLMLLCKLYRVNHVLEAFGYADESGDDAPLDLTVEECEVIRRYREREEMRPAVKKLLGMEEEPAEEPAQEPAQESTGE